MIDQARLLDLVVSQARVCLREFCQLRLVVDVWFGHLEGTNAIWGVSFDIDNTIDFRQIASDRGGAAPSRHVWDFEGDQRELRRCRIDRTALWRRNGHIGCRFAAKPSCRQASGQQHECSSIHVGAFS